MTQITLSEEDLQAIKEEVRKMFNSQHQIFSSYGSTIVPHDNGPILYFALPHHAKVKANKIVQSLD